jgi:GT2 family glycosyltransferase
LTVVVVDDGSTDGTAEFIRSNYPDVVLLTGTGDLWWTGATNLGMKWVLERAAAEDFILLMNNDLTFESDLVEVLVHTAHSYPKSVVASVESTINEPNRLLAGARRINWWTGRQTWLDVGRIRTEIAPGTVKPADYVTGRGVLYPVRCIREVGLVYRGYLHLGDFELGVRAAKRGWRLLAAYDAVVYHQTDLDNRHINVGPYRIQDIIPYYADRRSYANLRNICLNAIRCTRNPLQGVSFFLFSLVTTLLHFVRNVELRRGMHDARASHGKPMS